MITIKESHFIFMQQVNKLNSGFGKAFTPYEIDLLLNDAQLLILEEKLNSKPNTGVEFNMDVMNELAPIFVHKEYNVPVSNIVLPQNLQYNPYKYVSYIANVTKAGCTKDMEESKFEFHENNIRTTQRSNFKWGICKCYMTSPGRGLVFEPDGVLNHIRLSYYRYPVKVSIGGYTDINNTVKTTVEWTFTQDDIVLEIIKKAALLAVESNQPTVETKNFVENLHH